LRSHFQLGRLLRQSQTQLNNAPRSKIDTFFSVKIKE
jgi:hypothetical protein